MMVPHKIPMPHEYPWAARDATDESGWCWGMFKTEAEAQEACDAYNAPRRSFGFKRTKDAWPA